MKVLVICTSETWGGLEQTALRDVVELNRQGLAAELLCFNEGVIPEHAKAKGLKYHTIKNKNKYFNLEIFYKLRSIIKKEKFEIIHLHTFNTILPVLLSVMGLKVFVVATRHIYVEHVKKDLLHRFFLRRLNMLLAISDFARQNLLQTYPLPKEKVRTLYVGIDVKYFERSNEKSEHFLLSNPVLRDASNIIGVVGRIDPMKGQLEFIEAAHKILGKYPGSRFLVVGAPTDSADTRYLEVVKNRIKELGLDSKILFTGFCNDVSEPLSAMNIFVMPSYFEAFGLAALQGMANKVPVVASDKGSIKEIIPSKDYGIIIPPKDSAAIANAVIELLDNKKMTEDIIERAYKRVKDIFDQKVYFKELISIYKEGTDVKK